MVRSSDIAIAIAMVKPAVAASVATARRFVSDLIGVDDSSGATAAANRPKSSVIAVTKPLLTNSIDRGNAWVRDSCASD